MYMHKYIGITSYRIYVYWFYMCAYIYAYIRNRENKKEQVHNSYYIIPVPLHSCRD